MNLRSLSFSFLNVIFVLALVSAGCATTQPSAPPQPVEAPPPPPPPEEVPVEEPAPPAEPVEPAGSPEDWHHQDPTEMYPGIGTFKAYELLGNKKPAKSIVVAVIDSGIDVDHEDLKARIWKNADEIPGNEVDDDANGYADDTMGWNFIGGSDGENVAADTYELTREYAKLNRQFEGMEAADIPADQQEAFSYYEQLRDELAENIQGAQEQQANIGGFLMAANQATEMVKGQLNIEEVTPEDLNSIDTSEPMMGEAKNILTFMFANELDLDELTEYMEHLNTELEYRYNIDFDPRDIVGDDYEDVSERNYGNSDVKGPDYDHGTHVAGIIAGIRDNDLGMQGIADSVYIMPVRAVPDGDERDKDVANAIRYAVDNGANIINMSFGKAYSPYKNTVDEAIKYAEEKGVLMVAAAGNDGADIDEKVHFPTPFYDDGTRSATWIQVGASNWEAGENLPAPFSNYGQTGVDVFAPGVDIYSTLPEQEYGKQNGTSMAAPVVSGLAALLMSYFPELDANQIKQIILETATDYSEQEVIKPGSEDERVAFGSLSGSGRVVNAYEAVKQAMSLVEQ